MVSASSNVVRTTPKKPSWNSSFSKVAPTRAVSTRNFNSHGERQPKSYSRDVRRSAPPAPPVVSGGDATVVAGKIQSGIPVARDEAQDSRRSVSASKPSDAPRIDAKTRRPVPASKPSDGGSSRRSIATSSSSMGISASTGPERISGSRLSGIPATDKGAATTAPRATRTTSAQPAPSRGFRELQRSEQLLQEENERLVAAASRTANKLRTLKQEREELRATSERLAADLETRNEAVDAELIHLQNEFDAKNEEQAENMSNLRKIMDEREIELEAELATAKARSERLEKFVESLGINAVSLESFAVHDKENDSAIADLESKLRNISVNLEKRDSTVKNQLAHAKRLLGARM